MSVEEQFVFQAIDRALARGEITEAEATRARRELEQRFGRPKTHNQESIYDNQSTETE